MRYDMGRVVIERPRRGSSNRSLKARKVGELRLDGAWEDWEYNGPQKVPNSGTVRSAGKMASWDHNLGEKSFSDVLGPLDGYLKKSVGRLWDDVYSELSANLGGSSWPLQHILTMHVDVEVNTWLGVDGNVYADNKYGTACVSDQGWHRADEFYVHPITRQLCHAPVKTRRHKKERTKWDTDRVQVGDHWYVKIDRIWYIGRYRGRLPGEAVSHGAEWPHSDNEIFVKIKQANHKEIRRCLTMH